MTDNKTNTSTTETTTSTADRSIVASLEECAIPLGTVEPIADIDDLDPLYEIFGERRVIGLGEATHGTREFFQLKHRLIRFVVEELGYRIVGLEANFSETLAINEYVVYGRGDPVEALDGIYFWTWYTEEVLALVEWLREFNSGKPIDQRVKFYGFDAQFTSGPATAIADFLDDVDPAYLDDVRDDLTMLDEEIQPEDENVETKLERADVLIDELRDRLHQHEEEYASATSRQEIELVGQHLRTMEQAYSVRRRRHRDENPWAARDRFMAENVSWMLDYEDSDHVVLWAHNGHVRQGPVNESPDPDLLPMGHHLDDTYGDGYYALGFDFGSGSFQAIADPEKSDRAGLNEFTIDELSYSVFDEESCEDSELRESLADVPFHDALDRMGDELVFLDFESAVADIRLREWLNRTHLCYSIGAIFGEHDISEYWLPLQVTREFDGLLYVQETSRAHPIEGEL